MEEPLARGGLGDIPCFRVMGKASGQPYVKPSFIDQPDTEYNMHALVGGFQRMHRMTSISISPSVAASHGEYGEAGKKREERKKRKGNNYW
jgi:hypothetical protein